MRTRLNNISCKLCFHGYTGQKAFTFEKELQCDRFMVTKHVSTGNSSCHPLDGVLAGVYGLLMLAIRMLLHLLPRGVGERLLPSRFVTLPSQELTVRRTSHRIKFQCLYIRRNVWTGKYIRKAEIHYTVKTP